MKKITENALLFRVNQLKEKMAMYEDVGDGSMTPPGGLPQQRHSTQTPGDPGYKVKPYQAPTQQQTTLPNTQNSSPVTNTQGTQANQAINNMLATPASNTQTTPPAGKWPTTDAEIRAFQKANKLNPDGLIGHKTMAALQAKGIQPPAGFKPVADKHHPAAAQHHAGGAAKPAAQGQPAAASPEDAARDARMQQNQAFYNLSPEDQAAINQAHGQQSLHTAASNNANAATQTAMTQGDTLSKAAAQAANAALPATPPSSASTAQGPLGINFQSQQLPQKPEGVTVYNESPEYVSFGQEDSLARIIQLARG